MVSQKGSILVGVIGLSIVMAMAAGALLIVAGNSTNDEDMAYRRAKCYLDAESGLMMGVSWLRNKQSPDSRTFISVNQAWTADTKTLLADVIFDNGCLVTVTLTDIAPMKTVTSKAVQGGEIVQFSWNIGIDPASTNTSLTKPILALTNWRTP